MNQNDDIKKIVRKTASLARLEFSESDFDKIVSKSKSVLDYVNELSKLNTDGIEPTSHAVDIKSNLREDKVENPIYAKDIMKAAPQVDGNFLQVPKVIDSEE